jgi:hypothetical protein
MMDTHYQPMYKQAANTQHAFHGYTHAVAYDPAAKAVRNSLHALTNDLAHGKDARAIDKRIRNTQMLIRRTQNANPAGLPDQTSILSRNQSQVLNRNLEAMHRSAIQHPTFKV